MKNSKLFNLNIKDFLKGLVLAVGTPLIYLLQELLPTFGLTQWQQVALSAFIAYILKNYLTNSEGQILNRQSLVEDSQDLVGSRPGDR
jgi:hypothetical protein